MTAVAEPLTECKTRNAKAMENKTALNLILNSEKHNILNGKIRKIHGDEIKLLMKYNATTDNVNLEMIKRLEHLKIIDEKHSNNIC